MIESYVIRPLSATFTRDTQFIGTMDPYVALRIGQIKQNTKVCIDGGKTPTWNDIFSIPIKYGNQLYISVWDQENIGKDNLIGQGIYILNKVRAIPNGFYQNIEIKFNQVVIGELRVFFSMRGPQYINMNSYQNQNIPTQRSNKSQPKPVNYQYDNYNNQYMANQQYRNPTYQNQNFY